MKSPAQLPTRQGMPAALKALMLAGCALAASFGWAAARGQATQSAQGSQEAAQIRVTTRLVQLGVIVRDKNGAVTNLTKDDFTLLEKGKPQTISVFTADAAARNTETVNAAPAAKAALPLPVGTFSNLPQFIAPVTSGSITIVLLDNLNTLYGSMPESKYEAAPFYIEDLALKNAQNHLQQFVKEMKPEDRVAIYGLRHSLHVLCDFTNDRERLLAILGKYDASALTSRTETEPGRQSAPAMSNAGGFENGMAQEVADVRNGDRAMETAAALQAIVGHVAILPGRKNLVWLTADLPLSGVAMARILEPANIAVYPVDARGLLTTAGDPRSPRAGGPAVEYSGMSDADQVSGAAGHFDNMPAQSAVPVGINAMRDLADETGGQAFVNTNDITNAIRKAVEDSGVTYTLGFYVDAKAADGKFHELKVEVRQKGLAVLYPTGYFAYRAEPLNADAIRSNVITAVRSPLESSAIPMTASFVRAAQGANPSLKMQGEFELSGVALAQNGNIREGAVDIDVVQQDGTGKVLGHSTDRLKLQFTAEGYAKALREGVAFQKILPAYAGGVTLRVVVQDPTTGLIGSLVVPMAKIQ